MATLLIAIGVGVAFIVAYHTYGRWLGGKIFDLAADAVCPSVKLRDDVDYCPTAKPIVFGHHFTSIAGTGPIVGPAIGVMWGWVPALLWVVFGSIFIGAVHDFGALVVSLRNNGQTVGDIAGRVLNRRVRLLFLFVLFLSLTIVLAIFGLVIAAVFREYRAAIIPCLIQIPIAVVIGTLIHRRGRKLLLPSIVALAVMYLTVIYGNRGVLGELNATMAGWSTITWVIILLVYSYIASVLPVWTLLQPRDYINSLQLLTALGLIVVGLLVAAIFNGAPPVAGAARPPLEIVAPAWDWAPAKAPLIFPFLFVTIACGAISGFHCLVSSGTSSKQLRTETDARFVGYGSMLTEGFLATLVILACVAGLGLGSTAADGSVLLGQEAWAARYASWTAASGLAAKIGAFVDGSANFLKAMGVPVAVALALMGVLVASFAGTTLDTACRLQRYVIQELGGTLYRRRDAAADRMSPAAGVGALLGRPLALLRNKHVATIVGVVVAFVLAAMPNPGAEWSLENAGKGGLILWPMFGATNQLLAGLAFLVVSFYLWRRRKPVIYFVLPMIFMLVMPAWAMLLLIPEWIEADNPNWTLIVVAVVSLLLEAWMLVEAALLWPRVRGIVEPELPPTMSIDTAGRGAGG